METTEVTERIGFSHDNDFARELSERKSVEIGLGMSPRIFREAVSGIQARGCFLRLYIKADTDMALHLMARVEDGIIESDEGNVVGTLTSVRRIPDAYVDRVYAMLKRELVRLIAINDKFARLLPYSSDSSDMKSNEKMSNLDQVLLDLQTLASHRLHYEFLRAIHKVSIWR